MCKAGKANMYTFVQDLTAINNVVIPSFPVVPNPATILSCIPANAQWITMADLCPAFVSPPHQERQ